MKQSHPFAPERFTHVLHRFGSALVALALVSCTTTEVVEPRIPTQLVLHTAAQGAANGKPFATPPTVYVADEEGNPVIGANFLVTLTVTAGATIIGESAVNAVDGVAVFSSAGLAGPVGTYTLTYAATLALGPREVSQSVTLAPGAAVRYNVSSSSSTAIVGTAVTITAQLVDAHDSPTPSAGTVVAWSSSSGQNGSLSAATSQTDASGRATVTFTVDTVHGRTATITATDANSISGSTTVSTVAGPPSKLAFTGQPTNTEWGDEMRPPVIVTVQDRYSNTVTSGTTSVALSLGANPGGATLTGGGAIAAEGGLATFWALMLDQPGSGYTLTASSPGLTSTTSTTFDIISVNVIAKVEGSGSLTVFGDSVYFTDCPENFGPAQQCQVAVMAKTGGPRRRLQGSAVNAQKYGLRLIADGSYINVLEVSGASSRSTRIVRVPISSGVASTELPVAVFSVAGGPDFEDDRTNFYTHWATHPTFGSDTSWGIGRTRVSDGATQVLVKRTFRVHPYFAVAGGQIYYFDSTAAGRTIEKISVDSGASTTVVTGVGPIADQSYPWRRMLVFANTIYWVERDGSLRSAPISGGTPTTRATGLEGNLVTDGTYLYATGGGSIRRFRLSDFSAKNITTNEQVVDIALDSEAIFWVTRDGYIRKAPK